MLTIKYRPVRIMIWSLIVICWPIAKTLDFLLGPHRGHIYRSVELRELIQLHGEDLHHGGDVKPEAVKIMRGALDMQTKTVYDAMTSINDVYMLDINAVLDRTILSQIMQQGHSRIPIYEEVTQIPRHLVGSYFDPFAMSQPRKRMVGCVLTKNLLLVDVGTPIRQIARHQLPIIQDDTSLYDLLSLFEQSRTHMAIVVQSPTTLYSSYDPSIAPCDENETSMSMTLTKNWSQEQLEEQLPTGVVTFEDFIEQLLQQAIYDEKDYIKLSSLPIGSSGFFAPSIAQKSGYNASDVITNIFQPGDAPGVGAIPSAIVDEINANYSNVSVAPSQQLSGGAAGERRRTATVFPKTPNEIHPGQSGQIVINPLAEALQKISNNISPVFSSITNGFQKVSGIDNTTTAVSNLAGRNGKNRPSIDLGRPKAIQVGK